MAALTFDTGDPTGAVDSSSSVNGLAYTGAVLTDAPVGYWRLGETTGTTAADSSGNGRTGTYAGTYTQGQPSLVTTEPNAAVAFTAGRVTIATNVAFNVTSNITVEAVIKTTMAGSGMIVSRDESGRSWQFRTSATGGKVEFLTITSGGAATTAQSVSAINDGLPHHVAATYDGSNIRIYIDGTLDKTQAATTVLGTAGSAISIGQRQSGSSFVGVIDEVAFYTTVLTGSRVAAHAALALLLATATDSVGPTDSVAAVVDRVLSSSDDFGLADYVFYDPVGKVESVGLTDELGFSQATITATVSDAIANPGTVTATVAGGLPLEGVTINLLGYGSNPLTTSELDDAGTLAQVVAIPSGNAGAQSLQIVLATSGAVTVAFDAGPAQTAPTSPGAPTPPTPVTTTRWVLEDVGPGGITYTFPNNPARMSSPHPRRTLTTERSTSPDGQALIWEGAARPHAWEFEGYCGTEAFYDALKLFVDIDRRFYLTDHRSRQWVVSFDAFDARPRRDLNNDWAHDYTMRATIYGGPL